MKDCSPMKKVIDHAKGDFHTLLSLFEDFSTCKGFGFFFVNCGSQAISAIMVKITQNSKAPSQPKSPRLEIGTLTPDATEAKRFINTAYRPVIIPTLNGKDIFIYAGINTFPIAIESPISPVPINKDATPKEERRKIPAINTINAQNIVHSMPILFAIFGANGDRSAKASNGSVVIIPANVLLIAKSSLINGIKEPTEVNGARKLEPINKIPIINIHVLKLFFCVVDFILFIHSPNNTAPFLFIVGQIFIHVCSCLNHILLLNCI